MINTDRKKAVFRFQPFSEKQLKVLTWWNPASPYCTSSGVICDGAIRSGKTVCLSLSFVMWAMENFEHCNFALCGKTIGSLRRNVVGLLKTMLASRNYKITDHRADNLLTVSMNGRENYFYLFGGKDESSQDLIQGITLAGVLLDEAALMPKSFVDQATARCSVNGSKFWFSCNPDGPFHWFRQEWINRTDEKDMLYLHFTMDDNLSLSEEIKARYRSQWTGVFYQRYILGEWAAAEGIVYDMFDPQKHIIHTLPAMSEGSAKYVSIDYGTLNPTVFLLWERSEDGRWICTREYYYDGRKCARQKTDEEYADDLCGFIGDKKIKYVIIDPSAASLHECLRRRGLSIIKAKNNVLDGIRLTGSLLQKGSLLFSDCCVNTRAEFGSYIWDSRACAYGEDKPVKEHDHAMDAVRYFCNTILGGRRVTTGRIIL
ncbi:PBSX family phage terminase large subunit [uncultured Ruminococcus sp.]|uniref:PBSX family phage terminase large subunit n=1 Tax=uncultured Ruminococcus sp. TaxID=165186 RepID=UPI0025E4F33E|nr:PBSX family phage terminase large subunit [uncultured Ruminococcus sp.]